MTTLPYRPTLTQSPDSPDIWELEFDNTSLETFTTCGRQARNYIIYRREMASNRPALYYGGVIHKALEPRFRGEPYWEEKQQELIIKAFEENPAPIDEWRSAECALECMRRYNKTHPYADEPFTVVEGSVERGFRLLLGEAEIDAPLIIRDDSSPNHIREQYVKTIRLFWTGRMDALVLWDGGHMVLDHKTGSMSGQSFYDEYLLSAQPHGYAWAARKMGYPVDGFVLDALIMRKPSGSGQTSEFRRERYWDTYTQEFLDEWEQDVFDQLTDFLEHWARGRFSKVTKWCQGKYGACQYFQTCVLDEARREAALWGPAYKDVSWSPLTT